MLLISLGGSKWTWPLFAEGPVTSTMLIKIRTFNKASHANLLRLARWAGLQGVDGMNQYDLAVLVYHRTQRP